jgi:hypothetical protein
MTLNQPDFPEAVTHHKEGRRPGQVATKNDSDTAKTKRNFHS